MSVRIGPMNSGADMFLDTSTVENKQYNIVLMSSGKKIVVESS